MRRRREHFLGFIVLLVSLLVLLSGQVGNASSPPSLTTSTPTATLRPRIPITATPSPHGQRSSPTRTATRPVLTIPSKPTLSPSVQPTRPNVPPIPRFTHPTTSRSTKSPASVTSVNCQPSGLWEPIYCDDFEPYDWPYWPWVVNDQSNDGYDRKWGDSDYMAHQSTWALWPAADGFDLINPPDYYANNMDTRMIYGPIDLSNADHGYVRFWLWRDMESCCDNLRLEASHTGNDNDFQEVTRWTGSSAGNWEQVDASLDNYVGDSSVWVAWRFYSDYSVTGHGAWVDDIELWKSKVPGLVTAYGYFQFSDETYTVVAGSSALVYLYDHYDSGYDSLVAGPVYTNGDGYFQFPAITNWNYTENRRLNLHVRWQAKTIDSINATHQVTNIDGNLYEYYSVLINNVQDGWVDLGGYVPGPELFPDVKALWIWRDLRRAWEYVYAYGGVANGTADPGSVNAKWQFNVHNLQWPNPSCPASCFYYGLGGPYIFIADYQALSQDLVIHETAHEYMWRAESWNMPGEQHGIWDVKDVGVSWSEGWADFFPLPVNGDTCFNWDASNYCPVDNDPPNGVNLEWHSRSDGLVLTDQVEGRVAGALYDLLDLTNDGYDNYGYAFSQTWGSLSNQPHSFHEFWDAWKNRGYDKHWAVQSIFQNGINYNSPPVIAVLPNIDVFKNTSRYYAIDLWSYGSDPESQPWQLYYWIFSNTNPNCGVSISPDDRWIHVVPTWNWIGSCDVTIKAVDGIVSSDRTFTVRVLEPAARLFLPLIMK